MTPKQEKALIAKIIKLHGPVLDLRKSPAAIIDILRRFSDTPDGGDAPCGGVPPQPPEPPPGPAPSRSGSRITTEDLMTILLKLSREVATLKKSLAQAPTVRASVARAATTAKTTRKSRG